MNTYEMMHPLWCGAEPCRQCPVNWTLCRQTRHILRIARTTLESAVPTVIANVRALLVWEEQNWVPVRSGLWVMSGKWCHSKWLLVSASYKAFSVPFATVPASTLGATLAAQDRTQFEQWQLPARNPFQTPRYCMFSFRRGVFTK